MTVNVKLTMHGITQYNPRHSPTRLQSVTASGEGTNLLEAIKQASIKLEVYALTGKEPS
jgi:hypothetical protein